MLLKFCWKDFHMMSFNSWVFGEYMQKETYFLEGIKGKFPHFLHFRSIWIKFGTGDFREISLRISQFRERRGNESRSLLGLNGSVSVKDKAIPLQAWTGPEVSRWLRLPDFETIGT
jgi:hypothetical protein